MYRDLRWYADRRRSLQGCTRTSEHCVREQGHSYGIRRFGKNAITALQVATEAYLVEVFEKTNEIRQLRDIVDNDVNVRRIANLRATEFKLDAVRIARGRKSE